MTAVKQISVKDTTRIVHKPLTIVVVEVVSFDPQSDNLNAKDMVVLLRIFGFKLQVLIGHITEAIHSRVCKLFFV
jgi:hypothetical protein